jgi:hypothetical protein
MSDSDARSGGSSAPHVAVRSRVLALLVGVVLAGALYLLLIDTVDLPELYAGAGAAVLSALAFEAAREQGFTEATLRPGWLLRTPRPLARIPGDIARVSVALAGQLLSPRRSRGVLRAVPFSGTSDSTLDTGRRVLAEALGSLAPNTIIVGVDRERGLIMAHQLQRSGDADTIDVLKLR